MGRPRGARRSEVVQQRRIVVVQVPPSACTAAEPSSVGMVPAAWGLFWPLLASTHQGEAVAGGGGGPGEALVGFGSVPGEAPGASQRRSGAHPGPGWRSCPGGVTHAHLDPLGGSRGGLSFLCACLGRGWVLPVPALGSSWAAPPAPGHPRMHPQAPSAPHSGTWVLPPASPGAVPLLPTLSPEPHPRAGRMLALCLCPGGSGERLPYHRGLSELGTRRGHGEDAFWRGHGAAAAG